MIPNLKNWYTNNLHEPYIKHIEKRHCVLLVGSAALAASITAIVLGIFGFESIGFALTVGTLLLSWSWKLIVISAIPAPAPAPPNP